MIEVPARRLVFITTVWPEPTSSAAGVRSLELISAAVRAGHSVTVLSPGHSPEFRQKLSQNLNLQTHSIAVNDSRFDDLLRALDPQIVVFERFLTEEQFGWRVAAVCPHALRVLDTQDLHSLRAFRKSLIERTDAFYTVDLPTAPAQSDELLREVSAILRCDWTVVTSSAERAYLIALGVPATRLTCLAFSVGGAPTPGSPGYSARRDFFWIGNFRHAPNLDSAKVLLSEIWPRLRSRFEGMGELPELHLYGAYPPALLQRWLAPALGARLMPQTDDAIATASRYRVSLAPIRYGAGIKGKILDSWAAGTPVVSTPAGYEGLEGEPGRESCEAATTQSQFVDQAVTLYRDEGQWTESQRRDREYGRTRGDQTHSPGEIARAWLEGLEVSWSRLKLDRAQNVFSALLLRDQNRATEYFSRWIELKERPSKKDSRAELPTGVLRSLI